MVKKQRQHGKKLKVAKVTSREVHYHVHGVTVHELVMDGKVPDLLRRLRGYHVGAVFFLPPKGTPKKGLVIAEMFGAEKVDSKRPALTVQAGDEAKRKDLDVLIEALTEIVG